jgi:hypothetical protein
MCSYIECTNEFEPKTHNQKYCSDECCRTATNLKIKQKYYDKKERLSGKKRICVTKGCDTRLTIYNPDEVCAKCEAQKKKRIQNQLLGMIKR